MELKERELTLREKELALDSTKNVMLKNSSIETDLKQKDKTLQLPSKSNVSNIQKSSNPNPTLSEIFKTNQKIFSNSNDKIFTDRRLLLRMKKLLGNANFEDFVTFNLWGLKNEQVNSNYFFSYYHACPRSCGTYGVIYGDIINNNLIVGLKLIDLKWYKENGDVPLPQKLVNWQMGVQDGTMD